MLTDNIYLDYAATTPVDRHVLAAMQPYFGEVFGNPSSVHRHGQEAEQALIQARKKVSSILHARPDEIIFTSGGTESDNLALRGTLFALRQRRNRLQHVLISPVEHHAVVSTARHLAEEFGYELEMLPVNEYGQVDAADVAACIRPETALVSVIYANNEIGSVNPIREIGAVCRAKGVLFHTDAVQAAAHFPLNVQQDQVDLLSIGAHKFYGPKGIGALYVRRGVPIFGLMGGGKQESGLRPGTENVPYIVGIAEAFEITQDEIVNCTQKFILLRDRLISGVLENIPRVRLTGHPVERLPNHASFVFEALDGNKLLMLLDMAGFSCSSGSACKTGSPKPSEVLMAIGLSRSWALGSLRVTLGRDSTEEHVERFLEVLPKVVKDARSL